MRKPSYYTQRQMHLELDWELSCFKQEVVQVAPRNETLDKNEFRLIAFMHNSQSSVEKKIQLHRKRNTKYTKQTQKVPSLLLCDRSEHNHRPQTTSSNIQKRCSNTVTETMINSTQNTPIKSQDHIKAWTRFIHSRLALKTKPQGKQRQRNT